jgi:hypothetical protein
MKISVMTAKEQAATPKEEETKSYINIYNKIYIN